MIASAVDWLANLTPDEAIRAFWHLLVFELPRYVLAASAVSFSAIGRHKMNPPPTIGASVNQKPRTVTVLLPGHNEAAGLRRTVDTLREQTSVPTQIIVVDDGSSDGMFDVANRLRREGSIDLALRTDLRSGKSAAANLALRYATGDFVVIADIDTEFMPDAIEKMARHFEDPDVGAVAGNLGVRNESETLTTEIQAIQYLISISTGRVFSDAFNVLFIVSGAVGMFRREALVGVAGWEVGPGEDADLTTKLRRAGWKITFEPEALALTDVPNNMPALIRQRLRWNRSLARIRLQKFEAIFSASDRQFSLSNAIGSLDILFFQAVLPFSFLVYLVWMFGYYGADTMVVLTAVSMIYIALAYVSFFAAVSHSGNLRHLRMLPYVPLYSLVSSYVLRFTRLFAIVDELTFQRSYKDTYVPRRVLDLARKDQE